MGVKLDFSQQGKNIDWEWWRRGC